MSSFHLRPRFETIVEMDPESWRTSIVQRLEENEDPFEIRSFSGFVTLRIHERDRHFWSPRLNLMFEETEPGTTRIQGFYGPNANVWSLFLFSYLIVGMLAFIAGIFTISQFMIDTSPWGAWPLGISLILLVILYAVAQFGQKLGAQQTFRLHQAFETAFGKTVQIR